MKKNINIRGIPEELYFEVLQLKASLKAETWVDFLREVARIAKYSKPH
jgi:hypothetical protein